METKIAGDEPSVRIDGDLSTKGHQDLVRREKVKKSWHYRQETLQKYHTEFSGVMDDITSGDFVSWEKDLEAEYRILKLRPETQEEKVKELHLDI